MFVLSLISIFDCVSSLGDQQCVFFVVSCRSTFDCFKDLETVKPYITEVTQAKDSWQDTQLFGSLEDSLAAKLLETFNLEVCDFIKSLKYRRMWSPGLESSSHICVHPALMNT